MLEYTAMAWDPHRLVVLGMSHATACVEIREPLYLDAPKREQLYHLAHQVEGLEEFFVLSTCNRIEFYAAGVSEAVLRAFLASFYALDPQQLNKHTYAYMGRSVMEHAFAVCTGLRSQLVGETQIAAQVKEAYQESQAHGWLGALLRRTFEKGLQASKWCRTHTAISRRPVSVGSVAASLAARIFGHTHYCGVLVLGAGDVAHQVVKALHSRGLANVTLSARHAQRGHALAQKVQAQELDWDAVQAHIQSFDIVIACTKAPLPLLTHASLAPLAQKRIHPWLLMDLGFPRNIDASLRNLRCVYLYDLDDLAQIAQENRQLRQEDLSLCEAHLGSRAALLASRFFGCPPLDPLPEH